MVFRNGVGILDSQDDLKILANIKSLGYLYDQALLKGYLIIANECVRKKFLKRRETSAIIN